jgi:hypothetical protein
VTWTTSAPAVATVSSAGVVQSVELGSATITARINGFMASAAIVVGPPVVTARHTGHLDAQVADVVVFARVTPAGQAADVSAGSVPPTGHVPSPYPAEVNADNLQPATLQRIER